MIKETARNKFSEPRNVLLNKFSQILKNDSIIDANYISTTYNSVFGIANLPFKAPVIRELYKNSMIYDYFNKFFKNDQSILITLDKGVTVYLSDDNTLKTIDVPETIIKEIDQIIEQLSNFAGYVNENGEHVIDLRKPSPGPHFNINLLIGNRMSFERPLQTVPKSAVDKFGGGSFRSHAATQVLATRFDMRPEENGHPSNRQFYILENNRKMFYSADVLDSNIKSAKCVHSNNNTVITYTTKCGLDIKRTIFILPQYEGLPLATETQRIEIKDLSGKQRDLRIVYTGMFGTARPHALFEDVMYTTVIMQSSLYKNDDGAIIATSSDYSHDESQSDIRFNTLMIRNNNSLSYPKEFCSNINEFIGNGSLENPENLTKLTNNHNMKGPGFFALAGDILLNANSTAIVDNFTCLVSFDENLTDTSQSVEQEIQNLINKFSENSALTDSFSDVKNFFGNFKEHLQLDTEDLNFDAYINNNLPFQVMYQSFVSRAFAQTQKGYREIGFREIQDLYASMYYFEAMGQSDFVKKLLIEWTENVFEFGYANHNFFWKGKEPGKWSDDALWLIQAIYRYVTLTGDNEFLDKQIKIAGSKPAKTRSLYDTLKAIITYSSEISIGKHGIPLLDYADWNDCLKLDNNSITGPEKELAYKEQLDKNNQKFGVPFESDFTESVMNGFLLKVAIDELLLLAKEKSDSEYVEVLKNKSSKLFDNLQTHAWKEDFFARTLFNRYKNNEISFLGAKNDGFSNDPNIDGTYFLNSFSWSVISNTANEKQVNTMIDIIEKYLKTPYGLKLVSPLDLCKVARDTATSHYFEGDRENGGVFKHASMMATYALLKVAKDTSDKVVAQRASELAYWMIDLVLPYNTLTNPFEICGNPRFCTQYNNSNTGENIGPLLSGTASWLNICIKSALGIEYNFESLEINPIIKDQQTNVNYSIKSGNSTCKVNITKPEGFYRIKDSNVQIIVDGILSKSNIIPKFTDAKTHSLKIIFS